MDTKLLSKLFGGDQRWHSACTIVIDAEAGVQALGADSIGSSAVKSYAPRLVSGRIVADAVCFVAESSALLAVQQQKIRQGPNEEIIKQTLSVIDSVHIIAVEFFDTADLAVFHVNAPVVRPGSHGGTAARSN